VLADVLSHATQVGANTAINFGAGDVLTLQNVNVNNLAASDFIFNSPPVNHVPVVTASNTTGAVGQVLAVSSLFSASDADNDALYFNFWDNTASGSSGHFSIGGVAQGANQCIGVSAAGLANTTFVVGSVSDSLFVRAFDGSAWSDWTTFQVTPVITNHVPVVTASNTTGAVGQVLAASSLFNASDADNDTLYFNFWDNTASGSSGHFNIGGVAQGANQCIGVSAAGLANTTFVVGSVSDSLFVRAFDGSAWSDWTTFQVSPTVTNHVPIVTATNTTGAVGQVLAASSLFNASDADNDTLYFNFWDNTASGSSGHFNIGGVAQGANQCIGVSAAGLANTTFAVGSVSDTLFVRAFDGSAWSDWTTFQVSPAVTNHAPVVSASDATATAGQVLAASSLFNASDADNDTLYFNFWDDTASGSSGHFSIGGVAQGASQCIGVSAAGLANTTFVAGSVSDSLYVRAFDGSVWSDWQHFSVLV
jgi:hypothetical protein